MEHYGNLGGDRFQIHGRLGTGGMGVVYEAYDQQNAERVALKTLLNVSASAARRFENEFQALKDVEHPNLVNLKEFFRDDAQCYFSMELIDGTDFLSYVRHKKDKFDETRLRSCLSQLVVGISTLHRYGKVHRDLKPSNMLVTADERLVILDFGLVAEVVGGHQVGDVAAMGSAGYMSPEQSIGMPISAAADWYSVGVVLYQILTGRLPFEGSALQIRMNQHMHKPTSPAQYADGIPGDLLALCLDLLSYNSEERPSGREIFQRLGLEYPWKDEDAFDAGGAEAYVENIPFVGRDRELGILAEALEQYHHGEDLNLLIVGEPGIGKTTLAREFLTLSKTNEPDLVVLSGRFAPNSPQRFQAFDTIVDQLADQLIDVFALLRGTIETRNTIDDLILTPIECSAVMQVFPALMRVGPIVSAAARASTPPAPQHVRLQSFQGLRKLLAFLASKRLLVLFLDDVQWAKTDSLDLLQEIVYPEDHGHLFVVATMRSSSEAQSRMEQIFPSPRILTLKPLPQSVMLKLAETLCRRFGLRDRLAEHTAAFAREARGHPLFLAELVRYSCTAGTDIKSGRLEDTLLSRVELLDPAARHVLELVSLAGVALDMESLADAADVELNVCAKSVSELVARHLVRRSVALGTESIEPYHDRVHEVVTQHISQETKKGHHRSLSYVIGKDFSTIDRAIVVKHLEAAGCDGDAASEARRAAQHAADSLAFGQAAEMLRTALKFREHSEDARRKMLMDLGDALCNIRRGAEASQAYLEARQGADLSTRFALWRRAAEQLVLAGHFEEGIEELRLMLREIGETFSQSPISALLSLLWRKTLLAVRGLNWKDRDESDIQTIRLVRVDVYQIVAETISSINNIIGADYQAKQMLAALKSGEKRRIGHAFIFEALYVALQGTNRAVKVADGLLKRAEAIDRGNRYPHFEAMIHGVRGVIQYVRGSLYEADRLFIEYEKGFFEDPNGPIFILNNVRLFRVILFRFSGDLANLKKTSKDFLRDAARRGDEYMETGIRYLHSQIWLFADDPERAEEEMSRVKWSPPRESGYHVQHWYETIARAELAIYRGTIGEQKEQFDQDFKALSRSLLPRIGVVRAESGWLRGRILVSIAAASSGRDSRKLLAEAWRLTKKLSTPRTGFRQSEVWALLLRAAIADQRGDADRAATYLQDAIGEGAQKESPQLVASAERRLGQIVGGEEGARLVEKGDLWMRQHGVVNIPAMTELFAPGFRNK